MCVVQPDGLLFPSFLPKEYSRLCGIVSFEHDYGCFLFLFVPSRVFQIIEHGRKSFI